MFGRNKKKTESITQLPQISEPITPKNEDYDDFVEQAQKPQPKKWDEESDDFDSVDDGDSEEMLEPPQPTSRQSYREETPQTKPQIQRPMEVRTSVQPQPIRKTEDARVDQLITWANSVNSNIAEIERVIDQFAEDINQRVAIIESKLFRLKGSL